MSAHILLTVLRMNFTAAITAAVVLTVKFILVKLGAPRKTAFFLWLTVAFRLVCPFAPASDFSLFNALEPSKPIETAQYEQTAAPSDVQTTGGLTAIEASGASLGEKLDKFDVCVALWLTGAGIMLIFGLISYLRLKKRLRFATKHCGNVYMSENISNSFVFGIFSPKIYIPDGTDPRCLRYIIAHERAHIKRGDHILKIIAYLILSVNWFNPINPILFRLFSDDMELICDEEALYFVGLENRREYMNAFLSTASASRKKHILFYSVHFSENIIKRRIKNMMKLKKCPAPLAALAVVLCILTFAVLGTNASASCDEPSGAETAADTGVSYITATEPNGEAAPAQSDDAKISETLRFQSKAAQNSDETTAPTATPTESPAPDQTGEPTATVTPNPDADYDFVSFEQTTPPNGCASVSDIANILEQRGASAGKNYIIGSYGNEIPLKSVSADQSGRLSLFLEINAQILESVVIYDAETGRQITSIMVPIDGKTAYSFTGLDPDSRYDVSLINGAPEWEIEGKYIVY